MNFNHVAGIQTGIDQIDDAPTIFGRVLNGNALSKNGAHGKPSSRTYPVDSSPTWRSNPVVDQDCQAAERSTRRPSLYGYATPVAQVDRKSVANRAIERLLRGGVLAQVRHTSRFGHAPDEHGTETRQSAREP